MQSPTTLPQLHFLIACPRSGSTLLVRVFSECLTAGNRLGGPICSLTDCHTNMFRMLDQALSPAISCLVYERPVRDLEAELKRVCARWGVPFEETMLDFKNPFQSSFLYSTDRERDIYFEKNPTGLFTTVDNSPSVTMNVPAHGLLSNEEKNELEEHVGKAMCCVCEPSCRRRVGLDLTWMIPYTNFAAPRQWLPT